MKQIQKDLVAIHGPGNGTWGYTGEKQCVFPPGGLKKKI